MAVASRHVAIAGFAQRPHLAGRFRRHCRRRAAVTCAGLPAFTGRTGAATAASPTFSRVPWFARQPFAGTQASPFHCHEQRDGRRDGPWLEDWLLRRLWLRVGVLLLFVAFMCNCGDGQCRLDSVQQAWGPPASGAQGAGVGFWGATTTTTTTGRPACSGRTLQHFWQPTTQQTCAAGSRKRFPTSTPPFRRPGGTCAQRRSGRLCRCERTEE